MRKPAFRKSVRGTRTSSSHSLPSPVGGLNARDPIATMQESDAIVMKNMFPETTDVIVRKGFDLHVVGANNNDGETVESLMVYNAADGTQSLFAAAGTGIFDVTTTNSEYELWLENEDDWLLEDGESLLLETAPDEVVSSLLNAKWQYTNFTNSGGTSYLCCFNGEDSPRYWDGTNWLTITGASSPAITGVTTTTLVNASVHKRRMWLVQNNSLNAWYLPVDSVGGAANAIDLGGIASRGGYLVATSSWTIDAGEGIDDYWVAITSEGQLVIYQGTDPTDSSAWLLVGVWNVGEPLGRRCFHPIEGDLLLLTVRGVVSMARTMLGRTDQRATLTDKISDEITEKARLYRGNFGWGLLYYPQANMLLINVPVNETGQQEQYAMNTITGSWGGPFTGVGASCWALYDKEPYFGVSGDVGKFWGTFDDNGVNIDFEERQAYSYLNARGLLKYIKSVRPSILASGSFSILMGINVDFSNKEIQGNVSFSPPVFGLWDTGTWDDALWGGGLVSFNDWQTVGDIGTAISVGMKGAIQGVEFRHQATDALYERGGVIA